MKFLNRGRSTPADEKRLLGEIESLSRGLAAREADPEATDAAERRLARRIVVEIPCRFLVTEGSPDRASPPPAAFEEATRATLVNVSRGGLLLASPERLPPGTALWVRPDPVPGGPALRKAFAARTTVVRAVESGRRFLVGLVWVGVGEAEMERLAEALEVEIERRGGATHVGEIPLDDRRKHLRHSVSLPVRFMIVALPPIRSQAGKKVPPVIGSRPGLSRNVSRGGLLFATDVQLPLGSFLSLEIVRRGPGESPFRAKGEAVRVDEAHGRTLVGVRFVEPPEVDDATLASVLSLPG